MSKWVTMEEEHVRGEYRATVRFMPLGRLWRWMVLVSDEAKSIGFSRTKYLAKARACGDIERLRRG